MGKTQSKYQVTRFNPAEWQVQKQNGYCHILRNIHTNQQIQQYDLMIQGDMLIEQQLQFYQYRKKQKRHLVSVLYVMIQDSSSLKCLNKECYKIYTERIPVRLTEIDYLTFREALMVIRDSLIGYNEIKESYFGILKVTKEMIGINTNGEVKVWINEEFKSNSPDKKYIVKGYGNSVVLIVQIFSLVQEAMKDKTYPQKFKGEMKQLDENTSYVKAIMFVNEYARREGIDIPKKIRIRGRQKIQEDEEVGNNEMSEQKEREIRNFSPVMIGGVPVTSSIQNEKLDIIRKHGEITNTHVRVNPLHVQHPMQHQIVKNIPTQTHIKHDNIHAHPNLQRQISPDAKRVNRQISPQHMHYPQTIHQNIIPHQQQRQRIINRHERNHSDVAPVQTIPTNYPKINNQVQPRQNIQILQYNDVRQHQNQTQNRRSPETRVLGAKDIQIVNNSHSPIKHNLALNNSHTHQLSNNPYQINQKYHNTSQPSYPSNHTKQQDFKQEMTKVSQVDTKNNNISHRTAISPITRYNYNLNKPNQHVEPDNLNHKLDALSATIANMNKQFQQGKYSNY